MKDQQKNSHFIYGLPLVNNTNLQEGFHFFCVLYIITTFLTFSCQRIYVNKPLIWSLGPSPQRTQWTNERKKCVYLKYPQSCTSAKKTFYVEKKYFLPSTKLDLCSIYI